MYKIVYFKKALKDIQKIKSVGLTTKLKNLIEIMKEKVVKVLSTWTHYE